MSDVNGSCKIWTRFVSRKADGTIIKLRLEDRPVEPENDVYEFLMEYFVTEEAVHKASGVSKNEAAVKEYRELMTLVFKAVPIHAIVCCVDDASDTVGKILGLSVVQLMKNTDKFEDLIKDMEFKTEEMQRLLYAANVLEGYTEEMKKFDIFYYGRGIIVHPDYRRMGLAVQLVRVRELICADNKIPMTCAWMSAMGSQKAAEQNNWKTMSEVPREELEEKTGFTFDKDLPSFKFMYTTVDLQTEEIKNLKILLVLEDYAGDKRFETYYGGRGLMVHPDYRGLGLANEFVRVRKLVCIEHKIPMTCAWITAIERKRQRQGIIGRPLLIYLWKNWKKRQGLSSKRNLQVSS